MKIITATALLAACTLAGAGLSGQQSTLPRPAPAPQERHNFGMDWDGKRPVPVDASLPVEVIRFVDRWAHLPDRIEQLVTWTTFASGALVGCIFIGAIAVIVQIGRGK